MDNKNAMSNDKHDQVRTDYQLAERVFRKLAADAELAVKTILDAMAENWRRGERIEIRGFGSLA